MINIFKTNIKIILDHIIGKSLKSEKFAIEKNDLRRRISRG